MEPGKFGVRHEKRKENLQNSEFGLFSGDLEVASLVIVTPGSHHLVAFDFALDHVMDRLAVVSLSIEFQR